MECKRKECKRVWEEFDGDDRTDDYEFDLYHCEHDGCHEISYGKSMVKSKESGAWFCQHHGWD